jgi:uncharacterized membrane protein YdjX (TVP38/TMEM64 family)
MPGEMKIERIPGVTRGLARSRWWRLFSLAVVAVVLVVAVSQRVDLTELAQPEKIRALIVPFGVWGPLVFSAFKILSMLLMLPLAPFSIAAALLFGFGWGTVINIVTNLLGASIAFAIARRLGGEAIRSRMTGRWAAFERMLSANGFTFLFVTRLTPVFPFNIVSYAAAITSLGWRGYLLATGLGMMPTTLVYGYVGAAAGEASLGNMAVALTLMAALSVLPKLRRRRQAEPDPS